MVSDSWTYSRASIQTGVLTGPVTSTKYAQALPLIQSVSAEPASRPHATRVRRSSPTRAPARTFRAQNQQTARPSG